MGEVIRARRKRPVRAVVRVTALTDAPDVAREVGAKLKRAPRYVREEFGSDFIVEGGIRPGAWGHGKWGDYVLIDGTDGVSVMSPKEFAEFYDVVHEVTPWP